MRKPFVLEKVVVAGAKGCLGPLYWITLLVTTGLALLILKNRVIGAPSDAIWADYLMPAAFGFAWLLQVALGAYSYATVRNPQRHPLYRDLAARGPLEEWVPKLQNEVNKSPAFAGWVVTGTWLVELSTANFTLTEELAWVYKYGEKQPRCPNEIYFHTTSGQKMELTDEEGRGYTFMRHLESHCPWIETNLGPEVHDLWENHREKFLAKVKKRRADFLRSKAR